ncbi:restriction endonuclease subunit S [Thioclava sp.]|uniref:restriction endonuclease subunit S n=1 Tax=Thioclava sp. TaxID=1933450 RepID=UPI003AA96F21
MSGFVELGALCSLITKGTTPNAKMGGFSEDGINYIKSESLNYDGYVDQGKFVHITPIVHKKLKRSILHENDVLVSIAGANLGKCGIVSAEMLPANTNQAVAIVRVNSNRANPRFIQFFLRNPQFVADNLAGVAQSAQPNLNLGDISSFRIPAFPISEQREIAAILGALDDKIELNRKMAATLEEMARALYRSWFVDFDPVRAKAEGRAPAHMDTTTAALFPDSFGEDGLPVGWPMESLAQHVSVSRGLSYKGAGLCEVDAGVPLHNLNSVFEGGGYKTAGIKYYSGDFKPRHEIVPGDLIVTNTEQGFDLLLMGHAALVPHYFGPTGLFSQHIYKVAPKAKSPLSREWLYLMLSVSPKGQEIRSYSNGTTVNMLPMDALEIPEVLIPSRTVVDAFDAVVKPMFARKESIEVENQTLATLRDTLLPKLMSGEIRVGEAREQVEAVA